MSDDKKPLWHRATDSFVNLVAQLGTTKDKRAHGAFQSVVLGNDQLEAMYENDWLSGKVVDAPVDDSTAKWRTITAPKIDSQIEAVRAAEVDIGIQAAFNQAQKWADLYRGGAIVMVLRGDLNVREPLDPATVKQGDLLKLEVFDSTEIYAQVKNTTRISEPFYRQIESYTVNGAEEIHASRVLRFVGVPLPWRLRSKYSYWGASRLQRFYDAARNSRSTTDSIASMIYEAKVDVLEIEGLYQTLASPGGLNDLINRFSAGDQIKSFNNTLLLDSREKHSRKATNFAGLPDLMTRYMLQASAAADIPVTRLFGQSAMGLSATGEGDDRVYRERLARDQNAKYNTPLARFDQVFARSVLGFYPEDWKSSWNPLREMTQAEIAEVESKNAARDEKYRNMDVVPRSVIAAELRDEGVYGALDDAFIETLKEVEDPPDSFEPPDPDPPTFAGAANSEEDDDEEEDDEDDE